MGYALIATTLGVTFGALFLAFTLLRTNMNAIELENLQHQNDNNRRQRRRPERPASPIPHHRRVVASEQVNLKQCDLCKNSINSEVASKTLSCRHVLHQICYVGHENKICPVCISDFQ